MLPVQGVCVPALGGVLRCHVPHGMTKKLKKKKNLMKIKVSQSDTLPYYVGYFLALFIAFKKKMFVMNSYSWVTTCSLKKIPLRNQRRGLLQDGEIG